MAADGNRIFGIAAESSWFDRILSSEEIVAALLVLVLTPILRILWLAASALYLHFVEWKGRRIERCTVTLGPLAVSAERRAELPREIPIDCLLIRFGTDSYISKLASDQERFEGRRRLEISHHKLALDPDRCSYSGKIQLKVHRRLGTQFKLFIEAETMLQARRYRLALRRLPEVADVSISHYGTKPKVWLLLNQFHKTRTLDDAEDGDEIWNNHYWPI